MKAILRTKDGIETIVNDYVVGRRDYYRVAHVTKWGFDSVEGETFHEEETMASRQYEDRGERVPVLEEV